MIPKQKNTDLTEIEKRNVISQLMIDLGEFPPVECPVTHRFAPGVYMREIFMPAGSIVVGKIHKTEHFNNLISGKCTVFTVDGVEEHKAPSTFVSRAGIQKVVVMHTDCQWQTIHPTDETDIDEIEKEVIASDYDELETQKILSIIDGGDV